MKVSELSGALLDYWVARAEGIESGWLSLQDDGSAVCVLGPSVERCFEWSPSVDWGQGGPIIERERMYLEWDADGYWVASTPTSGHVRGPTPLIAAMRAYVASKFGENVLDEVTA